MKLNLSEMEITGYRAKHEIGNSVVYLMDCMELMRQLPDKSVPLACCDPEYGIGASEMTMGSGKNKKWAKGKKWDKAPAGQSYFNALFSVSRHQIIWGGNYFDLIKTKSWIFWDKGIYGDCDFADGELAWTSFDSVLRVAKIRYKGFLGADDIRIHPTQKPVALYDWIFKNYAEPGQLILDTHLGSQSSRIAAYKAGLPFIGCELDEDYFREGCQRFEAFVTKDRELKELGFAKTELNKNNPTLF